MPAVLITFQRVLDVARDGAFGILVGAPLRCERGLLIVVALAKAHGAAIAQVLVHALNAEHPLELPIGYERRAQQRTSVVELFAFCKDKPQRIGAREHQAHAAGREHIGKQGSALDKIGKQRHLVDKHRVKARISELAQIAVDLSQRIKRRHPHERRARKLVGSKVENRLPNEGGLPRATKPAQHEHLIVGLPL